MSTALLAPTPSIINLIPAIRDSVMSPRSKALYTKALADFLAWNQGHELERTRVLEYRQHMLDQGYAPATVNLALTAIRRLAEEAEAQNCLSDRVARQILAIDGLPNRGVKFGNWLTQDQALELLALPDQRTNKGLRDFVALGLLLGCGLRSDEAVRVRINQVQERDGRLVLLDILGKGRKFRTAVVPKWMENPLLDWITRGKGEHIIRRVWKNDVLDSRGMTTTALAYHIVALAAEIGVGLSPHDLRRSFAASAVLNGANIESVRQALGHESLATTTRYVASAISLRNPACDFVLGGK
jgi:site-specific recombinase XerD